MDILVDGQKKNYDILKRKLLEVKWDMKLFYTFKEMMKLKIISIDFKSYGLVISTEKYNS